ncbi:CatB-related O-acetyltransferase [Actinobacillus porcinus]|uniref:CatB-related O-acetyltransferase n=1 Tax=Actinobacillus porcinus TaxID=51048 RepID=UPI002A91E650|nr:CatB-related O-acetyltransferase [Actinobacillus porcinus]MDY6216653.1 CatB-related O-acetyltransferase [Actinobacillus porcinus]
MLKLTEYFCGFSWENGTNKRYFKLKADGTIEDLFGSQGHDNERFWLVEDKKLVLLSNTKQKTSEFNISEEGNFFYLFSGVTFTNQPPIRLRLFAVKNQTDLFEAKTKFLNRNLIKNGYLIVGNNTYGSVRLIDAEHGNKVVIGNYCSIAEGATFIVGYHRTDLVSTFPFRVLNKYYSSHSVTMADHSSKGSIVVGNDVWIGLNVTIMSGVKIGDGAVIATNAVVTKDVEPYSMVGGNPAKHLKYRINDEKQRKAMLEIAWWNWSEETVSENINKIANTDIAAFIKEFQPKISTEG